MNHGNVCISPLCRVVFTCLIEYLAIEMVELPIGSALFVDDREENLQFVNDKCPCIFTRLVKPGKHIASDTHWRKFKDLLSPSTKTFADKMHLYRFENKAVRRS